MKFVAGSPSTRMECFGIDRRSRRIEAFDPSVRDRVAAVTVGSGPLEDLAESFPALLFALITEYGTPGARDIARTKITSGNSLRDAAKALGLPWWLRRLPASAFVLALPPLPDDTETAQLMTNAMPHHPRLCSRWLNRIIIAERACGGAFTGWVARHGLALPPPGAIDDRFVALAAWAWFSGQTDLAGSKLVRRPWTSDISPRRALDELLVWRRRVALLDWLGPGLERTWIADGAMHGYDFTTLRTVDDYIEASQALDNCLDQYAGQLSGARSCVVAIRQDGSTVACMELTPHGNDPGMPSIVQLRTSRNRRAPEAVWQAAYAWLGAAEIAPMTNRLFAVSLPMRQAARRALWKPYLQGITEPALEAQVRRLAGLTPRQRSRPRCEALPPPRPNLGS